MAMRDYRKGNWTVEETMILIEAKKKDDERRKFNRSKQTQTLTTSTSKPITELRWKWVEEYCWGKGCFRSQNQCNDKWDNLMRDYKKVREYLKNLSDHLEERENIKSYWNMDKVERKDKGLPTNMLPQIYQALFDVVERSSISSSTTTATPSTSTTVAATSMALASVSAPFLLPIPMLEMQQSPPSAVPALQLSPPLLLPSPLLPPPSQPPPPPPPLLPHSTFISSQALPPHPSPTLGNSLRLYISNFCYTLSIAI